MSTKTASIETTKLLIYSMLLTKGAEFVAVDISNIYIQNEFNNYHYICFAINMIPQDIIDEYNLTKLFARMDPVT